MFDLWVSHSLLSWHFRCVFLGISPDFYYHFDWDFSKLNASLAQTVVNAGDMTLQQIYNTYATKYSPTLLTANYESPAAYGNDTTYILAGMWSMIGFTWPGEMVSYNTNTHTWREDKSAGWKYITIPVTSTVSDLTVTATDAIYNSEFLRLFISLNTTTTSINRQGALSFDFTNLTNAGYALFNTATIGTVSSFTSTPEFSSGYFYIHGGSAVNYSTFYQNQTYIVSLLLPIYSI